MQRPGKVHSAGLADGTRFDIRTVLSYLHDATKALESAGDSDAAFRFEMLYDYLKNHYNPSKPLRFENKHLGL